jgi:hypothetical protein
MKTNTTSLYCYDFGPMDFGWDWLPTVAEFYAKLAKSTPDHLLQNPSLSETMNEIEHFIQSPLSKFIYTALALGRKIGWDGDFRENEGEPRIVVLPHDEDFAPKLALIWKQDHRGTTFMVSPCELPWLGEPSLVESA